MLAPAGSVPLLSRLFLVAARPASWDQASHDFLLDGQARLADVAALYGTRELTPEEQSRTLEEAMLAVFSSPPVEGDALELAGLRLTVTRMEGPRVIQVGLLLPRNAAEDARDGKDRLWRMRGKMRGSVSRPWRRKP